MRSVILAATTAFMSCAGARAAVLAAPYSSNYTLVDLGTVSGVPTSYGGIGFLNEYAVTRRHREREWGRYL